MTQFKQSKMKSKFSGHANKVTDFSLCGRGDHFLLYSKQFNAINEIVISGKHGVAWPKQIWYSYACRDDDREMTLWLHEIEDGSVCDLFKI